MMTTTRDVPSAPIDDLLAALISRYRDCNPDFNTITEALLADGIIGSREQLTIDHLAFRTLGIEGRGIAQLERIFLYHGYVRRDRYAFTDKHLDAHWYSPPQPHLPRLFISELRVGELSATARSIVGASIENTPPEALDGVDLDDAASVLRALYPALRREPVLADYTALLAQSEYAAWTTYNRNAVNHVALSVHPFARVNSVAALNPYLEQRGYTLNGGRDAVQTSADGLLVQSSIVAHRAIGRFADGETAEVAGSYVEFVERRPLPAFANIPDAELRREHRRDGFEAANADRIFESTDLRR